MAMATATQSDIAAHAAVKTKPRLWSNLGFQVALSMVLGIGVGLIWPDFAASLKILGDIFLRLIKTAVAPLVFLTVAAGIAAAGDIKRVGKVGLIAMIYFEIVSTIALTLGLVAGNLIGVGKNLGHITASATSMKGAEAAAKAASSSHTTFDQFLLNVFPDNFIGAFARGELLQVLVIALIFGFGLMALSPEKRAPIENGLNTISTAFFEFIHIIMRLAPIGTFGAVAYAVGANGTAVLISLAYFVLSFYAVIVLFIVVVFGAICALFRISLFHLLRYIRDEIIIMLGTASSESVLPRLLEKLPAYGASKQTVGLVTADRLRLQSRRHVAIHVDGRDLSRKRLRRITELGAGAWDSGDHGADFQGRRHRVRRFVRRVRRHRDGFGNFADRRPGADLWRLSLSLDRAFHLQCHR